MHSAERVILCRNFCKCTVSIAFDMFSVIDIFFLLKPVVIFVFIVYKVVICECLF